MRFSVLALICLPVVGHAQSTQTPAEPGGSCAIGMTWDSQSQSCVVAAEPDTGSPLDALRDHTDCTVPPAVTA